MSFFILVAYVARWLFEQGLEFLNRRHLREHGHEVPPEFEGSVDGELLKKTSAYNLEYSRLMGLASVFRNTLYLLFLFCGWIAIYDGWIATVTEAFVPAGVLFFLGLQVASAVLRTPFQLYATFGIENRYGFNRKTWKLWLTDAVKGLAVSTVLMGLLAAGALTLMTRSPDFWWLWVWVFMILFQVLILFIAPFLLGVLFFKFEPLRVEGLEEEIRALVERAGFKVRGVFQIDASRRTTHSNAFFMGLGRSKRIALFDTLIGQLTREEILSVLGHEVGHWKKRHMLKKFAQSAVFGLLGTFLAFQLLRWGKLPFLIGLESASLYIQVVILGLVQSVVTAPLGPLFAFLSRRDEREADRFSATLTGKPEALASALVKMCRDNLSNLHPHPLYAAFHYSHPPDVERVRFLRSLSDEKK